MSDGLTLSPRPHHAHAHVIHQPGTRLLHAVLPAFVRRRVVGRTGRPVSSSLNLTSYIDFLLVTVIFLLMSFSASGATPKRGGIDLPSVENGEEMLEAPMIAVNGQTVMVDGTPAGDTRAIQESGRLGRIVELFELMLRKRELWTSLHPDRPFPGAAILQVDANVPTVVTKSVFQTAVLAGYPNLSFMVRQRARTNASD